MAKMQAMTMTGPLGILGHWQMGQARNAFEPALSPQGDFNGRMAETRLGPAANGNHIPFCEFHKSMPRYVSNVVSLRLGHS